MSTDALDTIDPPAEADAGPLGPLPWLSRRQARLDARLTHDGLDDAIRRALDWLTGPIALEPEIGRPEIAWRAAGLGRPGVIGQFSWPRLATRLALALEPAIAHALVDRLLGHERPPGGDHLQVTPVEWGILTYVFARFLDRLADRPGPLGPWDLTLDRVGPEPFRTEGLGGIVTLRWPIRIGHAAGSARLWVPETVLNQLEAHETPPPAVAPEAVRDRFGDLEAEWVALAGTIDLPGGLRRFRPGAILPIAGAPLRGTVLDPVGEVTLTLRDAASRWWLRAEPAPQSAGSRLLIHPPIRRDATTREPLAVSQASDQAAANPDVPVTLTVELGRVNVPLSRLSELKPGDVLELGRQPREPVELTSGGKLVARGELVQIDTELGVRVLSVFT